MIPTEDATAFLIQDMEAQKEVEKVEVSGQYMEVSKEDMQDEELLGELADLMR